MSIEKFNFEFFKIYKAQRFIIAEILLILLSAIAMPIVEGSYSNAKITSFGDAVYWGIITVTTVGYGDKVPVSSLGKIISSVLAISGLLLFGITISMFGVYFSRKRDQFYSKRNYKYLDHLSKEMDEVKKEVEYLVKK